MEITTPPADQPSEQGAFGHMLQQARTSQQISLEAAAAELFILKRHLQALEAEDFAALPQVAFARGFAINYAKFLHIDPEVIATKFDAAYPDAKKSRAVHETASPLQPIGTLQRGNRRRLRINPLLIVAVLALLALALFLFNMVSHANKEKQAPTSMPEEVSAIEQMQGAALGNQGSSIGAAGSALNLDTDATLGAAVLDIKVSDTATVAITDASGSSLMSGSQSRGDYRLEGTPPFTIDIDDIDKVSVQLNQQAVALEQYATDKQARFELTP